MIDRIPILRIRDLLLVSIQADLHDILVEQLQSDILKEFQELDIEDYGVERFNESFSYTEAGGEARNGFPLFAGCRIDEGAALTPAFVTP